MASSILNLPLVLSFEQTILKQIYIGDLKRQHSRGYTGKAVELGKGNYHHRNEAQVFEAKQQWNMKLFCSNTCSSVTKRSRKRMRMIGSIMSPLQKRSRTPISSI